MQREWSVRLSTQKGVKDNSDPSPSLRMTAFSDRFIVQTTQALRAWFASEDDGAVKGGFNARLCLPPDIRVPDKRGRVRARELALFRVPENSLHDNSTGFESQDIEGVCLASPACGGRGTGLDNERRVSRDLVA